GKRILNGQTELLTLEVAREWKLLCRERQQVEVERQEAVELRSQRTHASRRGGSIAIAALHERGAQHVNEWEVRAAAAVAARAPAQHSDPRALQLLVELVHQPALPEPRIADDRHERAGAV